MKNKKESHKNKRKDTNKDFVPKFENALALHEEKGDTTLINIIYRLVEYWNTYRRKKKGSGVTLSRSD